MNEEWIQVLRYFLFIRKIQGSLEWDPDSFQVHWSNFDDMSCFFAFQNTVSSPSRHSSYVEQFCSINHVVIFSPSNANSLCLHLKTEAPFIFPQRCSHSGLHTRWRHLSRCVKRLWRVILRTGDCGRTGSRCHSWQRKRLRNHGIAH